jgi:hypothetical protein
MQFPVFVFAHQVAALPTEINRRHQVGYVQGRPRFNNGDVCLREDCMPPLFGNDPALKMAPAGVRRGPVGVATAGRHKHDGCFGLRQD